MRSAPICDPRVVTAWRVPSMTAVGNSETATPQMVPWSRRNDRTGRCRRRRRESRTFSRKPHPATVPASRRASPARARAARGRSTPARAGAGSQASVRGARSSGAAASHARSNGRDVAPESGRLEVEESLDAQARGPRPAPGPRDDVVDEDRPHRMVHGRRGAGERVRAPVDDERAVAGPLPHAHERERRSGRHARGVDELAARRVEIGCHLGLRRFEGRARRRSNGRGTGRHGVELDDDRGVSRREGRRAEPHEARARRRLAPGAGRDGVEGPAHGGAVGGGEPLALVGDPHEDGAGVDPDDVVGRERAAGVLQADLRRDVGVGDGPRDRRARGAVRGDVDREGGARVSGERGVDRLGRVVRDDDVDARAPRPRRRRRGRRCRR